MKRVRIAMVFGVLAMAPLSCGGYECHGHQQRNIVVSAEEGCLSYDGARRAFPSERVTSGVKESRIIREAMTVCWYRRTAKEKWRVPCSDQTSRLELQEESAPSPRLGSQLYPTSGARLIRSCDGEGDLYGYVIRGDVEASGAVAATMAECPQELSIDLVAPALADEPAGSFVGRDFYPARLLCTYESAWPAYCGSGGGDTIGMLGG